MTAVTITDATTALRDWLRTRDTSASARIYAGGFPQGVKMPAASITRAGGPLDVPIDLGAYQIVAIASSDPAAAGLRDEIASVLVSTGFADLGDGLTMRGATVSGRWATTDESDPAIRRAVLTVQICTAQSA